MGVKHDTEKVEFNEKAFHYMGFLKWRIIRQAVLKFQYVFFFDADIVLFKNPWTPILPVLNTYQLWYQMESFSTDICMGNLNSGQLVFTRSETTLSLISYVITKENITGHLDQDWVLEGVKATNITSCHLPSTFLGYCWEDSCIGEECSIPPLVTFHACCSGPSVIFKINLMNDKIRAYQNFIDSKKIITNFANNSLVKCSSQVYWIQSGVRRAFPSAEVLMSWGFEWGQVQKTECYNIMGIPSGKMVNFKYLEEKV
jgi:hypothetical protein